MELNELKNTWDQANNEKQNISIESIKSIIQMKYTSKINRIAYPELIGTIVCLLAASYIGMNFHKLDTAVLQSIGVLSILLLLAISIISIISVRPLIMKNGNQLFIDTLKIFANRKLRFLRLQKINIALSYLLVVTVIILMSKFFNGIDLSNNKYFWIFSFSFGYLFILYYSKWVLKYYKTTLKQTEELLMDIRNL